ncbi:MAG: 50S ribosomal protein L24 [Candidatus Nomurabacteria bacterium]|nr:MAG: 50S ribosomal protein L24 [Candidatus Nomurabacteria bacterium]
MYIKKGDNVQMTTGKDRGKKGKVTQVFPSDQRVVVEGLNKMSKNVRARNANEKGQVVAFDAPVHISNVMLLCPKCGKTTRVAYHVADDKKSRQCRKCKEAFA